MSLIASSQTGGLRTSQSSPPHRRPVRQSPRRVCLSTPAHTSAIASATGSYECRKVPRLALHGRKQAGRKATLALCPSIEACVLLAVSAAVNQGLLELGFRLGQHLALLVGLLASDLAIMSRCPEAKVSGSRTSRLQAAQAALLGRRVLRLHGHELVLGRWGAWHRLKATGLILRFTRRLAAAVLVKILSSYWDTHALFPHLVLAVAVCTSFAASILIGFLRSFPGLGLRFLCLFRA